MNSHLENLARRVADDAMFLAAALTAFASSERLNDAGLANRLDCSPRHLTKLRLCLMPRSQPPFFAEDVERIATRCAVSAEKLREVVRRGQSLLALRQPAAPSAGWMLAARDRRDDPTAGETQ